MLFLWNAYDFHTIVKSRIVILNWELSVLIAGPSLDLVNQGP